MKNRGQQKCLDKALCVCMYLCIYVLYVLYCMYVAMYFKFNANHTSQPIKILSDRLF